MKLKVNMDKQEATFWIICFSTLLWTARTPLDYSAWQQVAEGEKRLRQVETKLAAMELVKALCSASVAEGTAKQ